MIIKLDSEWYIDDDGSGYTLYKWTGKVNKLKTGQELKVYDYTKYPPSLESCIQLYARLKTISSADSMQINEYLNSIQTIYTEIKEQLKIK